MNIKKQRYTSFLKYDGLQESNNNYINNEIINTHPVNNSPPIDYENKCKDFLEYIYIISLKRCVNRRELCIKQLDALNIKKYEIVDAVDTTVHSNTHDALYEQVTAKMDKNFIKHNFQKGALGCLLSHLKVIELAKSRNHKHILILEDDFLIINEFYNQLYDHLNNLPNGWDFVYLGKKLWHPTNTYLELHNRLNNVNKYFYKPNDETFASHAWLIKDTMYDILIQEYNKIDSPVDLCVMRLYNQYNFYACRDDLFITLFDSDIREEDSHINKWNWDVTKYYSEDRRNIIQNIIIYGFKSTGHTHHYIHKMYYDFFKYYYPHLNVIWYDNDEVFDHDHSIIFASPTHYKYKYMPLNSTCFYVFHLDKFEDNSGYKDIESFMAVKDYNNIITENRGIILLAREQITQLNYFQEDSRSKTICLPWFSNTMYQDIAKIRNNLEQIYDDRSSKKYWCFMGSVWYVNRDTVQNLINECIHRKIHLIIKGRIKVHLETHDSFYINVINFDYINDEKNTLEYLDAVYGIRCLLPIQGAEHNANYISNRIIETITMGYVAVTNNELSSKYYKSVYYNYDIRKILDYIDTIHNSKTLWCKTMRRQIDEALDSMYGYRNISKIMEFVKKISIQGNFITTSKYVKATYKIWFSSLGKTNRFFKSIDSIRDALIVKHDYIITHDNYDIFLAEQIIKQLDYEIYVDETHAKRDFIIDTCIKYNKKCEIKSETRYNYENKENIITKENVNIDAFPIYWINLDKDKDRNYNMKLQMNRKSNTRVPGVYGLEISKKDMNVYSTNSRRNHYSNEYLFANEIGCLLSHIEAIRLSLQKEDEYVIIMEDDTDLISWDNNNIKKYLSEEISKYECVQLSVIFPNNYNLPSVSCNNPMIVSWNDANKEAFPWGSFWSTSAYIISRVGRMKILNLFENTDAPLMPSDIFIYENLNTGTVFPPIIGYFSHFTSNIQVNSVIENLHENSYKRITDKYFKKPLILITTWFGELPHYFNIWLSTVKNQDYDILFITDQIIDNCPNNVKTITISFADFNAHINRKSGYNVHLKNAAKLVDLKPMYGHLFEEFIKYKYDYWGWTDIDMMMGSVDRLLIDDHGYTIYSFGAPSFGPMMIFSIKYMNFYEKIHRYEEILNDPFVCKVDEPWWFLKLDNLIDQSIYKDEITNVKYYSGVTILDIFKQDSVNAFIADWKYQCTGIDWNIKSKIDTPDFVDRWVYKFENNVLYKNNSEIYFCHMTLLKRSFEFSQFFNNNCLGKNSFDIDIVFQVAMNIENKTADNVYTIYNRYLNTILVN
jgi:glycosyl transferase family 25